MRREHQTSNFGKMVIAGIDGFLIFLAYSTYLRTTDPFLSHKESATFMSFFVLIWFMVLLINKAYNFDRFWSLKSILKLTVQSVLIHIPIFMIVLRIVEFRPVPEYFYILTYGLVSLLVIGARSLYKFIYKYIEFSGYQNRKVVIVGTGKSAQALYKFFTENAAITYEVAGFFDNNPNHRIDKALVKGRISDVKKYCLQNDVDEIYYAISNASEENIYDLKSFAEQNTIYFRITPDFGSILNTDHQVYLYDSIPVITARKEPLVNSFNLNLKRSFDIVFSLLVMIFVLSWLFPLVALIIMIDSPGPVIFKQLRPGKKNKLFECYKFRTMQVNNNTEKQATKADSRITRVGKILRKTSLDELPQFFNVLLGNMSVVGPRPNMITQLDEYSKLIGQYKIRHFITPGITGYAQVNGFRGETKEAHLMAQRVRYDVQYIENWSLMLDVKIIGKTVWNMLRGEKNAY